MYIQVHQGSLPFVASAKGLMAADIKTELKYESLNNEAENQIESSVTFTQTGDLVPDESQIQSKLLNF